MIKKAFTGTLLSAVALHGGVEVLKSRFPDADARSAALHEFAKEYFLPALLGGTAITTSGVDYIPSKGPFMLAPSHTIWNDHFTIPSVVFGQRPDASFRILAKHQLGEIPYVSDVIEGTVVYVNRKSDLTTDQRDVEIEDLTRQHAQRIIDVPGGNGVGMIYPWGTRERFGTLKNIGTGVIQTTAQMALLTGAEQIMLPVGAQGHQLARIIAYRLGLTDQVPAAVSIGEPIVITPDTARLLHSQGRRGEVAGQLQQLLQNRIREETLVARWMSNQSIDYPELEAPTSLRSRKNTRIAERSQQSVSQG